MSGDDRPGLALSFGFGKESTPDSRQGGPSVVICDGPWYNHVEIPVAAEAVIRIGNDSFPGAHGHSDGRGPCGTAIVGIFEMSGQHIGIVTAGIMTENPVSAGVPRKNGVPPAARGVYGYGAANSPPYRQMDPIRRTATGKETISHDHHRIRRHRKA